MATVQACIQRRSHTAVSLYLVMLQYYRVCAEPHHKSVVITGQRHKYTELIIAMWY